MYWCLVNYVTSVVMCELCLSLSNVIILGIFLLAILYFLGDFYFRLNFAMMTSQIRWIDNLLDGLAKAEANAKIALLFVYRPDCAICLDILDELNKSKPLCDESSHFVMIMITEDKLPPEYDIDGKYTPKILFLDPDGIIVQRYWNTKLNFSHAKFYYCTADQLLMQMQIAYNEQMGPQRHKCTSSACNGSWRRCMTPAACAFAFLAVVPALMLLFYPNQLVT